MSQSWSDFPVVDAAPDSSSCQQLADNTWSLLVMWAAGPEWIVATLDRTVHAPVVRVTDRGDGNLEYKTISFSSRTSKRKTTISTRNSRCWNFSQGPDWYMRLTEPQQTSFDDYLADIEDSQPDTMWGTEYLIDLHKRMIVLVPDALIHAENAR